MAVKVQYPVLTATLPSTRTRESVTATVMLEVGTPLNVPDQVGRVAQRLRRRAPEHGIAVVEGQ
jgi:hypothetical protein